MKKIGEIIRDLFTRDLSTSPLETTIFLTVIFGFLVLLIVANNARRRKEKYLYLQRLEKKWEDLCEKYSVTDEERDLLEKIADYLKNPEKKYLLLTSYDVLRRTTETFQKEHEAPAEVLDGIVEKTEMERKETVANRVPLQRRENVRRVVEINAKLAPIEHVTAHIETRMLDLSAGGCRIGNPERRFKAGDDLKITFTFKGKTYKDIPCEVVRTGAGQKTLHLSFEHGKSD